MKNAIIIALLVTMTHDAWAGPPDGRKKESRQPSERPGVSDEREEATPPSDGLSRRQAELSRLEASEPGLAEVRRAALRHAGLDERPGTSYTRRARLSALLPTLTVEVDRDAGYDRGLSRSSAGTERLDLGRDGKIGLELKAAWRLDRLLFSDLELRALKATQQQYRERTQLLAQVTTLYFQRRKLQIAVLWSKDKAPDKAALNRLAIAELSAQLDTLTGGMFTRMLAIRRARR